MQPTAPAHRTACATRQGSADPNCDQAAAYTSALGVTAAALVDGTGHSPAIAEAMHLVAHTAARIGAQRGTLAGLLSGAALVADRGPHRTGPTGVAVLAVAYPDVTEIAWIGDARAYGWDGTQLTLYTTDHTVGQQLRRNGAPWELAEQHDNWLTTSLAHATVATVYQVQIPAGHTVILTSDGIHDTVPHRELAGLVEDHAHDPQTLAVVLTGAAATDPDGERDDATAVILAPAAD